MPYHKFKSLLLALLFLIAFKTSAQNLFKGKVVDSASHVPIEMATVAVMEVKDTTSTLLLYTLTDKDGNFALHNLPAKLNLKVLISFVTYNGYRKFITLKDRTESIDLGTISLSNRQLKEVTIRERVPIVIRADTIEFAAEAFKVRPNAVVEDLLKKLPGVEVSGDGTVTVAGKSVSKILADGHQFFSNDTRIATKNLDVELIDKVQVYDDRENDPDHLVPSKDVNKIINLKFKKKYKKSIFGKVFAGAGTEDRYEGGGLVNMFRDTLQISILGISNNLNNTGFSSSDLYTSGGLNRGGNEGLGRAGLGGFGLAATSGIQKITSGGVNINNDYGKNLKINLTYFYTHTNNTYNNLSNTQRLLNDTTLTSRTINSRLNFNTRHVITSSVRWQPSNATVLQYDPSISIDNNSSGSTILATTFNNYVPLISQSTTADNANGSNISFSQSFSYNHQLKKSGSSINISHTLNISPGNSNDLNINKVNSYTSLLPSYLLNRYTNAANKAFDAGIKAGYQTAINKKLNFSIGLTSTYRHQVNNNFAFDLDTLNGRYDSPVINLSSALTRNYFTESITPGFIYKIKQGIQLNASVNVQDQQVNNQFDRGYAAIDQHFFNLLPSIDLSLGKFGVGYSTNMSLPNIGDMIPYSVVYSPLYSVTGNPDLKPTYRHNFGIRYSNYDYKNRTLLSASINYSVIKNAIFRQRTLDQAGIETSRPINMNGTNSLSVYINYAKPLKKTNDLTVTTSSNLGGTRNTSFFEMNGQNGFADNYSINLSESININWKEIEFSPSYALNASVIKYSGVNYPNQSLISHAAGAHFLYYWTKYASVEGSYTYTYNPLVPPGFQKSANLLSMNIAQLFDKDRAQIKLTCFDILNQSVSTSRSITENVITDNQSQILRRYFLLTLQYKFTKSLVKK